MPQPSGKPPANDRAYQAIKARLLDGTYPGGSMLSEGELGGPLGMSRTPVREALVRLELEGYVRLYPKRGALVLQVSPEEVDFVIEARLMIERHAAARLVEPDGGLGRELAACLERQRLLLESGRLGEFAEEDRAFHGQLVAAAGNPIVSAFYATLRDRQLRIGITTVLHDRERRGRILDEHRALLEAAAAGDVERCRRVIEDHLEGTRLSLRRLLALASAAGTPTHPPPPPSPPAGH